MLLLAPECGPTPYRCWGRVSLKIGELIAKLIRESVCVLRVKATLLLDVLGIDEDYAVDGLELVGAW